MPAGIGSTPRDPVQGQSSRRRMVDDLNTFRPSRLLIHVQEEELEEVLEV